MGAIILFSYPSFHELAIEVLAYSMNSFIAEHSIESRYVNNSVGFACWKNSISRPCSSALYSIFCTDHFPLNRPMEDLGCAAIFITDEGCQNTSANRMSVYERSDIKISMNGKAQWVGKVSVVRLLHGLVYGEVYRNVY